MSEIIEIALVLEYDRDERSAITEEAWGVAEADSGEHVAESAADWLVHGDAFDSDWFPGVTPLRAVASVGGKIVWEAFRRE